MSLTKVVFFLVVLALVPMHLAQAAFHFMQIEQVIGGVNGDTTAQAIQLRMRAVGQNITSFTRVLAVDATGANPVILENMASNVPNGQAGRRILLATPNFANYTDIPLVADFIMDPIPVSYLAAGQVRFMDDGGTIYWSLSWGGAGYTGSTSGDTANDSNGNFGPPVSGALPSTSLQALRFTGNSSAASTSNSLQYALTAGPAVFTNNAGSNFTLVAPATIPEPVSWILIFELAIFRDVLPQAVALTDTYVTLWRHAAASSPSSRSVRHFALPPALTNSSSGVAIGS